MSIAPRKQIWRSSDVEAHRGFEYYRDGICKSFMDLIPEPNGDDDWNFSGSVDTMPIGAGRLNRVVATSHLVRRTRAEIGHSPDECFYLNYKTRGECRINQSGKEIVIRPGDVGLFDSTVPFELEHRRKPDLAVSSFMIPHGALQSRLATELPNQPLLLSEHPTLGHLIRESAATLAREADNLSDDQAAILYDMLLDLTAMAVTLDGKARVDQPASRARAIHQSIRIYVDGHHRNAGLSVTEVASTFGISRRYLHKLFNETGSTFGTYVQERRLQSTAAALQVPAKGRLTISAIAFENGFSDPSHFHRAFKKRFGCTAGEWRLRRFFAVDK